MRYEIVLFALYYKILITFNPIILQLGFVYGFLYGPEYGFSIKQQNRFEILIQISPQGPGRGGERCSIKTVKAEAW